MGISNFEEIENDTWIFWGILLTSSLMGAIIYIGLTNLFKANLLDIWDYRRVFIQFVSFFLVPVAFLLISGRHSKLFLVGREGFSRKLLLASLVEGLLIYTIVIFPLFLYGIIFIDSNLFSWYIVTSWNGPVLEVGGALLLVVAINVGIVEFFTKSFVQIQILETGKYSRGTAFFFAMVAWCLGHIVEFTWLKQYVGEIYAAFLLLFAGLFSTASVDRQRTVLGVAIGHVVLNIQVWLFVNLF